MLQIIEFFITVFDKILNIFGKIRELFSIKKKYNLECFFIIFKEITDNFEDDYYYEENKLRSKDKDVVLKNILHASLRNVLYFRVKNYLKSYIKLDKCKENMLDCLSNFTDNFSDFLEKEIMILGYKDVYTEFVRIIKENEIHYVDLSNISEYVEFINNNEEKIEKILEEYKMNLVFSTTIINSYERIVENICLKHSKNLRTCALIYIFMNASMIISLNKFFMKSIIQKYDL